MVLEESDFLTLNLAIILLLLCEAEQSHCSSRRNYFNVLYFSISQCRAVWDVLAAPAKSDLTLSVLKCRFLLNSVRH